MIVALKVKRGINIPSCVTHSSIIPIRLRKTGKIEQFFFSEGNEVISFRRKLSRYCSQQNKEDYLFHAIWQVMWICQHSRHFSLTFKVKLFMVFNEDSFCKQCKINYSGKYHQKLFFPLEAHPFEQCMYGTYALTIQ